MRALVLAPQPFFSARGTPFSVYYRTMVMAEHGVSIDLLTYGQGEQVELPRTRIIRIPRFAFLGPVKTGPSMLKLFLDTFMFVWTVALLLRHRYDVVHAHEESVFFCRFLKPIFGFKLIYDMHSSLPQQLSNFEFTKSKVIKHTFEWLEDGSISASDAVITICPDLAEYVQARIGHDPKHVLIENSIFDPVRTVNRREAGARRETAGDGLPELAGGGPLVLYAGTFEAYQGLDLLLEAFALVVRERPDARLLMVGGTPEQVESHRRLAEKLGLTEQAVLGGRVSPELARSLTRKADVLVSPRSAGTNTPLKIYEQLASEKPIVATRIRSHTQVLNDDVAFLVEPNAEAIAEGILAALREPEAAAERAAAAKAFYDAAYSRSAYDAKIDRLLEILR